MKLQVWQVEDVLADRVWCGQHDGATKIHMDRRELSEYGLDLKEGDFVVTNRETWPMELMNPTYAPGEIKENNAMQLTYSSIEELEDRLLTFTPVIKRTEELRAL